MDAHLCNDEKKLKKLISKPHCLGFHVYNENLAAVSMQRLTTKITKPSYVGFSVL